MTSTRKDLYDPPPLSDSDPRVLGPKGVLESRGTSLASLFVPTHLLPETLRVGAGPGRETSPLDPLGEGGGRDVVEGQRSSRPVLRHRFSLDPSVPGLQSRQSPPRTFETFRDRTEVGNGRTSSFPTVVGLTPEVGSTRSNRPFRPWTSRVPEGPKRPPPGDEENT